MMRRFATSQRAGAHLLRRIASRVRNQRGETITEALVSVLIGGLALLMLAVVISATSRMMFDSNAEMNKYYQESNAMAAHETASEGSGSTGKLGVEVDGAPVKISDDSESEVDVKYREGEVAGKPVVSYWVESGDAEGAATPGTGGGS